MTEIELPRGVQVTKPSDQVSGPANGTNVGNSVGNVVGAKALSVTERAVFDAIQANPIVTAKEIATVIGKSERQVERVRASLRDAGLIERIGGTRGEGRREAHTAAERRRWPPDMLRCPQMFVKSFVECRRALEEPRLGGHQSGYVPVVLLE